VIVVAFCAADNSTERTVAVIDAPWSLVAERIFAILREANR
jgi:hypothetical protein